MSPNRWFLVLIGFALATAGFAHAAAVEPTQLRCEYLTDPLGIDVPQPRLSWLLEGNRRGAGQSAYQILVATSPKALRANQADLWDSGKVNSDQTLQVVYAGKPLQSGQAAWWKVRVWDQEGKVSKDSDVASWEMGLLNPADWKAKWIAGPVPPATQPADPKAPRGEPAPMFRKTFDVARGVKSARLYICGLGFHEVSLNGEKVGDHVLDPAYTQYNKRVLYVTHDVTRQLRRGKNALGVILVNGFYNQWVPDVWGFQKAPWRNRPALLCQLRIDYEDGTSALVASDTSWKTATGPIRESAARTGEIYDARLEQANWNRADFDDSAWAAAIAGQAPTGAVRAQMIEPMRVTKTLEPVSVKEVKPGVYVFDMGQNMTGWARLKIRGEAGTTLTLRFGERLNPDGSLNMSNINTFVDKALFQTDKYTLRGGGTETWEPRSTYHGFQYVEVTGSPRPLARANLEGRVVNTAFPQTGSFECSNDVINRLQHATLWSYIGNFQSFPTDCPHREKNGWTGDAHLAAVQAMYNFDNAAGYTKWINDCKDAQGPDGMIPDVVPDPKWTMNAGPAWESVYILIPWTMYQYNGDTRILAEHYDGMVKLMDRLGKQARGNLLYNGLGDWVQIQQTPTEFVVSSHYYIDAQIMARIAALLNKPDDVRRFEQLAATIRKAYNDTFFDKSTGLYGSTIKNNQGEQKIRGTQSEQALSLYHRLTEDADRPAVFKGLMDALARRNNHPDTGVFGAHAMPQVLTDFGQADLAFKMMVQPTGPGWGEWIARGYTTLQENWGQGDSQNHIFFGNISAWFYQALAGINIDPAKPAFKHLIIKPVPAGDLAWVKAKTRTIRGTVVSNWRKEARRFRLELTIPPGSSATVYLPGTDKSQVKENGKVIAAAPSDGGYLKTEVSSGTYTFTVENP